MLPERLRELVTLRTEWLTPCEYEWGQHVVIGRRFGVSDEERVALTAEQHDPARWSLEEHVALRVTDEPLEVATLGEDIWQEAAACWSDSEVLELATLVGFYRLAAGLLNSARVQREDGVPGWAML